MQQDLLAGRGKNVVILQSNYIPWRGYFDLISAADVFIFYDDVQFTKNDWRNRNKIKTSRGLEWLSIPVGQNIRRTIREVEITTHDWQRLHWAKLNDSYRKATHFREVAEWLEPLYLDALHTNLSELNRIFICSVCEYLGIKTIFKSSWDYEGAEGKTDRLVSLCRAAGASTYISGPAAKDYLDTDQFHTAGIDVKWFDYNGYPKYPQLWGAFEPQVSIVDLLFNVGREAPAFMQMGRN